MGAQLPPTGTAFASRASGHYEGSAMAAQTPNNLDHLSTPSLALAMVTSSAAPQLLLDGDFNIIALSASFCSAFDIDCPSAAGQSIFALGKGEWDVPQLRSLLDATATGDAEIDAYEMDLRREGQEDRRLVFNVRNLAYEDTAHVRLLVGIFDVTDARAGAKRQEDLVRDKTVLLQELQHRVANSMQIIASVILQTARRSHSEEARTSLRDAHSRVMSVAAVQQHLAASTLGVVELRPYFTKLCQSIGASMIRDHKQLSLQVSVDDSVVSGNVSVSMGLITTELVINALKHAFPGHKHGTIILSYQSNGPNWVLSVSDNGVGMPTDPDSVKPGLGTNIVQALAKQLDAHIQIAATGPGTKVSIVHAHLAIVDDAPEEALAGSAI
jgi:two-component sensor histidine kinase